MMPHWTVGILLLIPLNYMKTDNIIRGNKEKVTLKKYNHKS